MEKITNEAYTLPFVKALQYITTFTTGSNSPHLIKAVNFADQSRGQYVVKLNSSERMTDPSARLYELLAVWIAKELDLVAAEPAIVIIDHDFVDTLVEEPCFMAMKGSIGENYGCLYYEGYSEYSGNISSNSVLFQDLKDIFAFDMFISNADRRPAKPNTITNGKRFLVFDHELAFSFLRVLPFAKKEKPWILDSGDENIARSHYAFNLLKSEDHDFYGFAEKLRRLDSHFWERVNALTPHEWKGKIVEIQDYLTAIIDNKETFARQLTNILLR